MIGGEAALPPGRALDLGCGTGTNVVDLTKHGWEATGVDFSSAAIQQAQQKISGIADAHFIEGDVTKLRESGIQGPFDLVLDMGCYHALSAETRQAYVQEISAVMRPGAVLLMWEVSEKNKGIPLYRKDTGERDNRSVWQGFQYRARGGKRFRRGTHEAALSLKGQLVRATPQGVKSRSFSTYRKESRVNGLPPFDFEIHQERFLPLERLFALKKTVGERRRA